MAFATRGSLYLFVHNGVSPDEAEWNEATKGALNVPDPQHIRTLVFTDGGGPSNTTRAQTEGILRGRPSAVAVVTDSAWVRALVKVQGLTNPRNRAFSPREIQEAYWHLGLTADEITWSELQVREMRRQLDR
ncbi:STAS/SEC14 domain-containing protein [Chondromyces crocatus]|uniref:Uncharacterized protein n=1 Tax=Chondromyces crocatus TaxID=52 RepID=A0A0K1EI29_CHOCO|nr:STAS/SEC14 domain-containing protein [Chondromyces crocatus]AKT40514.1 uncharacterized protein CMC5_046690 [Chondromyces crocatus]